MSERPSPTASSGASAKVGRNDPCPCGSGKKYKKCCLDAAPTAAPTAAPSAALSRPMPSAPTFDADAPMMTTTGERVQLARAHFDILDAAALARALRGLRCVQDDPANRRRVWLWADEARAVKFTIPYERLSPRLHPIVIANLLERGGTLTIEVRAWERLIAALRFFRAHLPATALRLRSVHIVNRLISSGEGASLPSVLDAYFQGPALPGPRLGAQLEDALTRLERQATRAPLEAVKSFASEVERAAKAPLPPLEEIPWESTEDDDLETLNLNLGLRGLVALEHFHGNTGVTLYDMFQKVSAKL